MKKILYSMFALAFAAMTFTGCEDVPMPYDEPTSNNSSSDSTSTETAEPQGTGTADDPYNVAAVLKLYSDGTYDSSKEVYVKGKISKIDEVSTNYGNATYYISDDGTTNNQYEIFHGYYLDGEKFTAEDQLSVGMEVVVCGKLTLYNNSTQEMAQGNKIVSIDGQGAGGSTSSDVKGTGTVDDPYNIAAVMNLYSTSSYDSSKEVYVKGKISKISEVSANYGNATYYISDDGTTTNQYEIFRGYYLNGEKFTSEDQLAVGMEVVVCGKLTVYNSTQEMAQGSKIISINGQGSATEATGLSETFEASQGDFEIVNESMDEGLSYVWKYDSTNKYMKASAYKNSTNMPAVSYLVSPAFSLKGLTSATLTFSHTGKFFSAEPKNDIKVVASTDKTNWKELTISAYPDGTSWSFVEATCDLSAFAGQSKVYIAFKYTSTSAGACTWEVKNVTVK